MICPNCKVEVKADARFCHECGYPLPVVSNSETIKENQPPVRNVNVTSTTTNDPIKIDVSHFTTQNWVFIGTSALGALGCVLPWARVNVFLYVASVNGLRFWPAVVSFILFLAVIAYVFLEKALKIDEKTRQTLNIISNVAAPGVIILLTLYVLISILSTKMGVSPSIGVFVTLASSVFMILLGLNVVKFNK